MQIYIFTIFCYFFTSTSSFSPSSSKINNEPIIGILSVQLNPDFPPYFPAYSSLIPASSVKAVESAGAKVVPVVINNPYSYYKNLMKSLNGLVLPGGEGKNARGDPYYDAIITLYNLAKQLNANGTVFPILAICLGFEFIITAANNDVDFLRNCTVHYEALPLKFTKHPSTTSLFSRLTSGYRDTLENDKSTMNWHTWCVYANDFKKSPVNKEFEITSVSVSSKGIEFVASVEHRKYPFYGIQFHPEKLAFEWKGKSLPKGEKLLLANRYFYDQFIYKARSNIQTFASEKEEQDSLIYNYLPYYDRNPKGPTGTPYMQFYLF